MPKIEGAGSRRSKMPREWIGACLGGASLGGVEAVAREGGSGREAGRDATTSLSSKFYIILRNFINH